MAESQDVNTLKRRGRRRLVGAIALVLLAVIVLPWIFDPQPRQTPPVSVRIPSQDEVPFTPKPVPKPPPAVEAAKPAPVPDPAPAKPEAPQPAAKPSPAPAAERARAEAALANAQFIVPVGAYADPAAVLGKLKAAKLPYFTEPLATAKGTVTRVRAGPFASRDAAEKAHKQLKGLGFTPGNVAARS
jgi:DedD protein